MPGRHTKGGVVQSGAGQYSGAHILQAIDGLGVAKQCLQIERVFEELRRSPWQGLAECGRPHHISRRHVGIETGGKIRQQRLAGSIGIDQHVFDGSAVHQRGAVGRQIVAEVHGDAGIVRVHAFTFVWWSRRCKTKKRNEMKENRSGETTRRWKNSAAHVGNHPHRAAGEGDAPSIRYRSDGPHAWGYCEHTASPSPVGSAATDSKYATVCSDVEPVGGLRAAPETSCAYTDGTSGDKIASAADEAAAICATLAIVPKGYFMTLASTTADPPGGVTSSDKSEAAVADASPNCEKLANRNGSGAGPDARKGREGKAKMNPPPVALVTSNCAAMGQLKVALEDPR